MDLLETVPQEVGIAIMQGPLAIGECLSFLSPPWKGPQRSLVHACLANIQKFGSIMPVAVTLPRRTTRLRILSATLILSKTHDQELNLGHLSQRHFVYT